jgi:hypothetical protein
MVRLKYYIFKLYTECQGQGFWNLNDQVILNLVLYSSYLAKRFANEGHFKMKKQ